MYFKRQCNGPRYMSRLNNPEECKCLEYVIMEDSIVAWFCKFISSKIMCENTLKLYYLYV